MSKELEKLIETTNKIETCLVGDKLAGQVGLVDTVEFVYKKQELTDKKLDKLDDKVCLIQNELNNIKIENAKTLKFKKPNWLSAAVAFFGFYKG